MALTCNHCYNPVYNPYLCIAYYKPKEKNDQMRIKENGINYWNERKKYFEERFNYKFNLP